MNAPTRACTEPPSASSPTRWASRPGDASRIARAQLLAAGSPAVRLVLAAALGDASERALAVARIVGAGAAAVACLLVAIVVRGPLPVIVAAPVCCLAATLPGWLLAEAARRGAASAESCLPLALELVAASLRAGLPVDRALALASGCVHASLAGVLSRAAAGGGLPAAGLAAAAEASGLEDLASVAALIDRRMRLGLPLAPPLLAVAASLQARVRARTLARAGRRAPLAGLVTAMIVAPACALGLLSLILAGLLRDGHILGLG